MNRVEIRGGLTRDASVRTVGHGGVLMQFTVAVNGTRWDSQAGQQVVKTTFVTCQAWADVAEAIEAAGGLSQGDDVYVVGELDQYRKEQDDKPSTRVTVMDFRVLRRRQGNRHQTPPAEDPWK